MVEYICSSLVIEMITYYDSEDACSGNRSKDMPCLYPSVHDSSGCLGYPQVLSACHPTMISAPGTAPSAPSALGILKTPVAIWTLSRIMMSLCQVTVRKLTPSEVSLKTSCSPSSESTTPSWMLSAGLVVLAAALVLIDFSSGREVILRLFGFDFVIKKKSWYFSISESRVDPMLKSVGQMFSLYAALRVVISPTLRLKIKHQSRNIFTPSLIAVIQHLLRIKAGVSNHDRNATLPFSPRKHIPNSAISLPISKSYRG